MYIKILNSKTIPFIETFSQIFLELHDNSNLLKTFMRKSKIKLIDLSVNSWDINPTENMVNVSKSRLRKIEYNQRTYGKECYNGGVKKGWIWNLRFKLWKLMSK